MAHWLRRPHQRPQTKTRALNRSRYKGVAGVKRWVGLGVLADNMINIGIHLGS